MFLVIHPNHVPIGKGLTIQEAIDNWATKAHIDIDDVLFEEFVFIDGEEVRVKKIISYEKIGESS